MISEITEEEFAALNPFRSELAVIASDERAWFANGAREVIGTLILDKVDKDWGYAILMQEEDAFFRAVAVNSSIEYRDVAEAELLRRMARIESDGEATEILYYSTTHTLEKNASVAIMGIDDELKRYFARHPEELRGLNSRKFEELVANILMDFGFDVELTRATRDGGSDIIAYLRNAVTEYLTLVECKRYAEDHKVGVRIVREVVGVHQIKRAAKSIIVTTSSYTSGAQEAARAVEHLELKDYEDLKTWLSRY